MATLIDRHSFHTVFFDAGGTLVESPSFFDFLAEQIDGPGSEALATLLRERMFALYQDPTAEFQPIKDLLVRTFADVARKHGLPDRSHRAPELYHSLFLEHAGLFDGVLPVLDYLRERQVRLILISDADADLLYAELEKFGIRDRFEGFVISSEVRAYKPHDRIVAAAEKYCRDPRERILLVGDDRVDIQTAQKLGVKSALVHPAENDHFGADFVLERIIDLMADVND